MNTTFLKLVANDVVSKYGVNLSSFTFVFPFSTPIGYFTNCLFEATNESLGKPRYITISKIFNRAARLGTPDNLQLLCVLYRAYLTVLHKHDNEKQKQISELNFDDFFRWGEMMLSDFNDIDKALVDAYKVYREVSDIKQINDYEYLNETQKETLKKFFKTFTQAADSRLRAKYRSMWEMSVDIYTEFNSMNAENGVAYEGAVFKKGLEVLQNNATTTSGVMVFVGFNALSNAEKQFMLYMKNKGNALFYWDYDIAYCDDMNEAGRFVVENIRTFGNELNGDYFDNLKRQSNIRIIESPTQSGGAYYAARLVRETCGEKRAETVIVPTNAHSVPLLIHSLTSVPNKLRIRVKIPLDTMAVYALIMRCIDKKLMEYGNNANTVSDFLTLISNKTAEMSEKSDEATDSSVQYRTYLEIEAMKVVANVIEHVKSLVESGQLPAGTQTVCRIIQQTLRSSRINVNIPTDDEATQLPIVTICDLSDTRVLDFANVIVLGCNEGDLPSSEGYYSLIPNQVRAVYGLSDSDSRAAVGAYNFFRLIQRADNVALIYSSEKSGTGRKEMSRFLLQIVGEDKIPYKVSNITYPAYVRKADTLEIRKTPAILDTIKKLEATSLCNYIKCPLWFFFSKVAGIRTPVPDAGKMPANVFGTLFHEAIQRFYESLADKSEITRDILAHSLENNGAAFDKFIDESFEHNKIARNEVIRKIVKEYLKNVITYDMRSTPFKIRQDLIEKFMYTTLNIRLADGRQRAVEVGGKFDRVDIINMDGRNVMRVIDYKTSKWKKPLSVRDCNSVLTFSQATDHHDYVFQTFLYSLALTDNLAKNAQHAATTQYAVAPAVFFITAANKPTFNPYITYGQDTQVLDFAQIADDFRATLTKLIEEIFDLDIPFAACNNDNHCKFCEYKVLCNKKPVNDTY